MTENEYIEFQFVINTLKKFGFRLQSLMVKEIGSKKLIKSGSLQGAIGFEVKRAGKTGGELLFSFPDYGRFIEIRYFKRSENNKKAFSGENRAVFASKSNRIRNKRGLRKDTRWYSKTAYGSLNSLIGELMYGLTDAVKEIMRADLVKPYKS